MNDDEIANGFRNIQDAITAQTVGLTRLLGALATQTNMLKEILVILTEEPKGESPLQKAVNQLVEIAQTHTVMLERIENALATRGGG